MQKYHKRFRLSTVNDTKVKFFGNEHFTVNYWNKIWTFKTVNQLKTPWLRLRAFIGGDIFHDVPKFLSTHWCLPLRSATQYVAVCIVEFFLILAEWRLIFNRSSTWSRLWCAELWQKNTVTKFWRQFFNYFIWIWCIYYFSGITKNALFFFRPKNKKSILINLYLFSV